MDYLTFFRSFCERGYFVIPFTNEKGMGLHLLTKELTMPTIDSTLIEEIQPFQAHLFYHARYHASDLCPYTEHQASYAYRLVNEWVGKCFVCPLCEEIRHTYLATTVCEQPIEYHLEWQCHGKLR